MVQDIVIPDQYTVFCALMESADSSKLVEFGHFTAIHKPWGNAELWYEDDFNSKRFDTFGITILCCEDEEEYASSCACILCERFKKWYDRQVHPAARISDVSCWEQAEQFAMGLNHIETAVYENCCDYLYYGESLASLIERGHNYGLPIERVREIWKLALYFMAEGCMCDNPYTTRHTMRYVA